MRILVVDDKRVFSGDDIIHAKNAESGLAFIYSESWDEVWLDHDLGFLRKDGTWLVNEIERMHHMGTSPKVKRWFTHSANPIGNARMWSTLTHLGFDATMIDDVAPLLDYERTVWR